MFRKIVDGVVVIVIGVYMDDLLVGASREDWAANCYCCRWSTKVSTERRRRVHLVRWVRHRKERRVRYDQVIARSMSRELDDTL